LHKEIEAYLVKLGLQYVFRSLTKEQQWHFSLSNHLAQVMHSYCGGFTSPVEFWILYMAHIHTYHKIGKCTGLHIKHVLQDA